jgi:hypothetical protein
MYIIILNISIFNINLKLLKDLFYIVKYIEWKNQKLKLKMINQN